jgi:hypothetical protein
MTSENYQKAYTAAFAEASSELEQISIEINELALRRSRIEKAVAVLKGQIDFDLPAPGTILVWKRALMPGFKFETRVRIKDAVISSVR